jgi:molybdopterin molybdotransferase
MTVPPLKNNCFAMPAGVEWVPVDDALGQIQKGLHPVVTSECISLELATGRVLAHPIKANRSNPPMANSAIDGYGFCYRDIPVQDIIELPLQDGVAAAGKPYDGQVKSGYALRILTGAVLPKGVDTVVLEEDVILSDTSVTFRSGLRNGANVRKAAEDVAIDQSILEQGHVLHPQDLALLAATAVHEISVYKRLKVAVISTGTELIEVGQVARDDQIFDANKPMLLNMIRSWGYDPVDGGHYKDDPNLIRDGLNAVAKDADAILVSGGASAGDEDYVSRLLKDEGTLHTWRVAVKPGRPIAMALWNGVPTFGFPGNPVAAFVCALIFGLPALKVMAGQTVEDVKSYRIPSGFEKTKKAGRREYLRARVDAEGQVQVFKSEGSGRISGLTWSDGLVELPDEAADIKIGNMIKYIPYASFGL